MHFMFEQSLRHNDVVTVSKNIHSQKLSHPRPGLFNEESKDTFNDLLSVVKQLARYQFHMFGTVTRV